MFKRTIEQYQNRINLLRERDSIANEKIIRKLKRKIRALQSVKDTGLVLLLYKDARVDMNILDETVGAEKLAERAL